LKGLNWHVQLAPEAFEMVTDPPGLCGTAGATAVALDCAADALLVLEAAVADGAVVLLAVLLLGGVGVADFATV
jgi:hypothetical protein